MIDGEVRVSFTAQVENPAIKAIEIIPQTDGAGDSNAIRINAGAPTAFTDSRGLVWEPDKGFKDGSVNPNTLGFGGPPGRGGAGRAGAAYHTTYMQNHHGGMIVVDGALYGANGGNGGGFLTCLDYQTGEVLWRDRKAPKGSLLLADGLLYLRSEEDEIVLIEPSREGLVERGRFEQPDRSSAPAWAHPIIANGKLYIRHEDVLLCYDVKKK